MTAQLIQATDGAHLWWQRYDREVADIFAMQDEISASSSFLIDAVGNRT